MVPISYRRHRFPPVVIQHAVWLYRSRLPQIRSDASQTTISGEK
jgi:hypothetical protein